MIRTNFGTTRIKTKYGQNIGKVQTNIKRKVSGQRIKRFGFGRK